MAHHQDANRTLRRRKVLCLGRDRDASMSGDVKKREHILCLVSSCFVVHVE